MILEVQEKKINYVGEMGTKYQCEIDNAAFIFNLLRSKIYSNPARIICQEIASNARDAHREVGKDGVPVKIHLPSALDPQWRCRDYGLGVNPDRMENVFVRYGASTKREDNHQTGGFGIGAKTPWAYSDSFGIITYCPEEEWVNSNDDKTYYNVMIKRTYVAYVDETRIGCVRLLSEEVTEESQGTEIIVTVKEADFSNFSKWTRWACDYWDTRPIIEGDAGFKFSNFDIVFEGEDWELIKFTENNYDNVHSPMVILDGTPYSIDINSLVESNTYNMQIEVENDKTIDINLYSLNKFPLRLCFETGELAVTANRESIDYKESDLDVIIQKINKAIVGIRKQFIDKLDNITNLWEANVTWSSLKSDYEFLLPKVEWNGHQLSDNGNISIYNYNVKNVVFRLDGSGKIRYRHGNHINFKEKSILVLQDEFDKPVKKRKIYTLLLDNPGFEVQAIATIHNEQSKAQDAYDKFNQENSFDEMQPVLLSTVIATKLPSKNATGSVTINSTSNDRLKQLHRLCDIFKPDGSKLYNQMVNLKDGVKRYYVIYYRKCYYLRSGKYQYWGNSSISNEKIIEIAKNCNIDIYVIENKDVKYIKDKWETTDVLIVEEIEKLYKELKYDYCEYNFSMNDKLRILFEYFDTNQTKLFADFKNSSLTVFEYYTFSKQYIEDKAGVNQITELLNRLPDNLRPKNNNQLIVVNFKTFYNKIKTETPLIVIDYYGTGDLSNVSPEHIIKYLKMCEEEIENKI